jgi:uncharacterized protein (TIGR03083 family)
VDVEAHIAALEREGELLAAAAASAGPDAPIPPCPGWRMRDLVHHTGMVQRWATSHVAKPRTEDFDAGQVVGPYPDDAHLLSWFREGHQQLVDALRSAPGDLVCWTFLPAPSPRAFWARRQAHEAGIHRTDAESPATAITAFSADFASDGIDELLFGFLSRRRSQPRSEVTRTLHLHATDTDGEWLVTVGPDSFSAERGHSKADCALRGTASDLYLLVWNRRSWEGLELIGDPRVLQLWRDKVAIRWL